MEFNLTKLQRNVIVQIDNDDQSYWVLGAFEMSGDAVRYLEWNHQIDPSLNLAMFYEGQQVEFNNNEYLYSNFKTWRDAR